MYKMSTLEVLVSNLCTKMSDFLNNQNLQQHQNLQINDSSPPPSPPPPNSPLLPPEQINVINELPQQPIPVSNSSSNIDNDNWVENFLANLQNHVNLQQPSSSSQHVIDAKSHKSNNKNKRKVKYNAHSLNSHSLKNHYLCGFFFALLLSK